jgi:hypothetical protein
MTKLSFRMTGNYAYVIEQRQLCRVGLCTANALDFAPTMLMISRHKLLLGDQCVQVMLQGWLDSNHFTCTPSKAVALPAVTLEGSHCASVTQEHLDISNPH